MVQDIANTHDGDDSDPLDAFLNSIGDLRDDNTTEGCDAGSDDHHDAAGIVTPNVDNIKKNDNGVQQSVAKATCNRLFDDIYLVDPKVDSIPLSDVVKLKKRLGIETMGVRVPKPTVSFQSLERTIPATLTKRLSKLGYLEPTPMQCQALPVLLQGRDSILMGESGCGKTTSYLLPLVCHVLVLIRKLGAVAPKRAAYCVIVGLTREGCSQILVVLTKLLKSLNIRVATIASGYDNYNQVISGTEFLIVTPAKLSDMLSRHALSLSNTHAVVIEDFPKVYQKHPDESEILLNQPQAMKVIVSNSILGSGTLGNLRQYLKSSVTVKFHVDTSLSGITIKWISCLKEPSRIQKTTFITDLLSHFHQAFRMIIFANEKVTVEMLYTFIQNITESVNFIHEDTPRDQMFSTLEQFREGKIQILVSTDILTKNVNLPKVDYVIIFDMPRKLSRFCARCRVCQTHSNGVIYSLLEKHDHIISGLICTQLDIEGIDVPKVLSQLASNWKPYRDSRHSVRGSTIHMKEIKEVEVMIRPMNKSTTDHILTAKVDDTFTQSSEKPVEPNLFVSSNSADHIITEGSAPVEEDTGREYGIDDTISSDEEDIVPKRQLIKPTGLIDMEKIKQRRLRMGQEQL
ncbi:DEAD/DEAH box helicase family protein [Babesia bovis T2Bo]|uniref:RNA helicase n=1 Tax=Babesia bovis TaxID=5865 RepID=A7AU12_BABBO|nr:DEAD/DEAH box helicase family protein [Babesia bovis T2Bo]EDO06423.1 DEAD/DEAH box helicase family protein [Babesia bovis T2Bo]|eukprot:XP_001609991.1 hypothetical protein [Babesia bovis T2Bo]